MKKSLAVLGVTVLILGSSNLLAVTPARVGRQSHRSVSSHSSQLSRIAFVILRLSQGGPATLLTTVAALSNEEADDDNGNGQDGNDDDQNGDSDDPNSGNDDNGNNNGGNGDGNNGRKGK